MVSQSFEHGFRLTGLGAPKKLSHFHEARFSELLSSDDPRSNEARQHVDSWLAECDASMATDKVRRLSYETEAEGAMWELFVAHVFRAHGYKVDVIPRQPGGLRTPDFRVTRGEELLIVEASIVQESDDDQAISRNFGNILHEIDTWDWVSRFVRVEMLRGNAHPDSAPEAVAALRSALEKTATHDEAMTSVSTGLWSFNVGFVGEACPTQGVIGLYGRRDRVMLPDESRLRRKLRKKAKRYSELDSKVPFILAIQEISAFPISTSFRRSNSFYGSLSLMLNPSDSEAFNVRQPDGLYGNLGAPQNAHLSGVLLADRLRFVDEPACGLEYWSNPFSTNPIDVDLQVPVISELPSELQAIL